VGSVELFRVKFTQLPLHCFCFGICIESQKQCEEDGQAQQRYVCHGCERNGRVSDSGGYHVVWGRYF
jgi:hypothetical protein